MQKTSSQVSRILKRLHLHGLIKKARDTYRYYPTRLGLSVIATGLKLKELCFHLTSWSNRNIRETG